MRGYSISLAEAIKSADGNLLGVQLGLFCLEHNISAIEVARTLGVTRQTVYNWFRGDTVPQPHHRPVVQGLIESRREAG